MKLDPLLYDVNFNSNTGRMSFYDKVGGLLYSCVLEREKAKHLTFTALEDGTVMYCTLYGTINSIYISKNGGAWSAYRGANITLDKGDTCRFRTSSAVDDSYTRWFNFKITAGLVSASGNVLSMVSPSFATHTTAYRTLHQMFSGCTRLVRAPLLPATTLREGCYEYMFRGCTELTQAPALPATKLAESCYKSMFSGCTGLTQAPELPATTLAESCYANMFSGCTGLTQLPELPVTTLASSCYAYMFSGCTGLTQLPELPATTLASSCYSGMFSGCTGLTQAPELPATTLAESCYNSMFSGCTGLTQAPELPATTLASSCYASMFSGCTGLTQAPELPASVYNLTSCYAGMFSGCLNLTQAPKLPTTNLSRSRYCYKEMFKDCSKLTKVECGGVLFSSTSPATTDWLSGVSPTGDFYADPNVTWETGTSGIPSGWVRKIYGTEEPLTFWAGGDGYNTRIYLKSVNAPYTAYEISYNGVDWEDYIATPSGTAISFRGNKTVSFRRKAAVDSSTLQTYDKYVQFSIEGYYDVYVRGNINSMLSPDFKDLKDLSQTPYAFTHLFDGCTKLLRNTNTNAMLLPATKLSGSCYSYMFYGCSRLTQAPVLPANTLAQQCYESMFTDCTSLTQAPELPAATLVESCYAFMFSGCSKLTNVTCYATDISASSCTLNWLTGVSATGDFYADPSTEWSIGTGGIPENWVRHDIAELEA